MRDERPDRRGSTPRCASSKPWRRSPARGEAYLAASFRLGRVLADGSGNERLAEILGSLARQTRRYSKLGLATAARRKESARTWRAMAEALKAGDSTSRPPRSKN